MIYDVIIFTERERNYIVVCILNKTVLIEILHQLSSSEPNDNARAMPFLYENDLRTTNSNFIVVIQKSKQKLKWRVV